MVINKFRNLDSLATAEETQKWTTEGNLNFIGRKRREKNIEKKCMLRSTEILRASATKLDIVGLVNSVKNGI